MTARITETAVIMQPTFLPWLGFFDLIDQADFFVFLDSVQFEKQSWQQRNKIRTHKGLEWITVPVLIRGRFGQLIKDAQINQVKFPHKHIKQIRQNYNRAPYFKTYDEELCDVLRKGGEDLSLCNLNIRIIKWVSSKLSLSTQFVRSSELDTTGKRSELLVNILKKLNTHMYLSPLGSLNYIKNEYHFFHENKITFFFNNYVHPEYNQTYRPFIPYASIIDLLFNEGDKSIDIIRSGRRKPINGEDLIK